MIVRLPALMAFFLMALSVPALAAEDAVTLGIGAPLSGAGAMYGPDVKTGVELAVEDINAQGGVLGKKLKPVFEDDVCDPKTGVVVANRFISMGIDMAAHFCGPACLAAAPVYAEENVLMLTAACSPPQLTSMGLQNIARVYLGNEKQSPALAKLIGGHFAGKKLGFVFSTDSYSQSLADGITEELKKTYGIDPDFIAALNGTELDFSAIITQLKDKRIDVVYLGAWPKQMSMMMRQAYEAGYKPQFIGADVALTDDMPKIAGAASEGMIFTFAPLPEYTPSAAPVLKKLAERNMAGRPFAIYNYMMIQVYAEAVKKAGTTETAAVMKAMKSNKFATIMGEVSFEADGRMTGLDFQYYQWKDGKVKPWKM